MRFLCNENVPRMLVRELRSLGHDVDWVTERMPGAADVEVLRLAGVESRICVTFDKDFGELAARTPAAAAQGVILLRAPSGPDPAAAGRIAALLDGRQDWAGHFSVVEPGRLRMRRLDPGGSIR